MALTIVLEIEWNKAQTIGASITGIVSILLALYSVWNSRRTQKIIFDNQRSVEQFKNELATDMEKLKNDWTERRSLNDARRAYEFEARKRLYREYEPLLFQLMEASDNALHRIQSLARTAKDGNLGDDGWLSRVNYYAKSTIYKLFVPLAVYQIMQKKLTLVDISVDKKIGLHYKLVKQIYLSYTDDYEFARCLPSIAYSPNVTDWKKLRIDNQSQYWRQGLPMGILDKTIEFLIAADEKTGERVITFGEFEKKIPNSLVSEIGHAIDLFQLFHPANRPILWRILICQAIIFTTLLELRKSDSETINEESVKKMLLRANEDLENKFNWQSSGMSSVETFREPFLIAQEYLAKRF